VDKEGARVTFQLFPQKQIQKLPPLKTSSSISSPELSDTATPNYKGSWEIQPSFCADMGPARCASAHLGRVDLQDKSVCCTFTTTKRRKGNVTFKIIVDKDEQLPKTFIATLGKKTRKG
jgi:hypothetical protein